VCLEHNGGFIKNLASSIINSAVLHSKPATATRFNRTPFPFSEKRRRRSAWISQDFLVRCEIILQVESASRVTLKQRRHGDPEEFC